MTDKALDKFKRERERISHNRLASDMDRLRRLLYSELGREPSSDELSKGWIEEQKALRDIQWGTDDTRLAALEELLNKFWTAGKYGL